MVTDPRIDERKEQPTVGVRVQIPMSEMPNAIPQCHDEAMQWMRQNGIQPTGAPILRYHVINMPGIMHLEMAWPVAEPVTGNGRVIGGSLPAGRYASLVYTGDYSGLYNANGVLIEWAKTNGIEWDRWDVPEGDAFRARYETYITDPGEEPDPSKWVTEVAIKLADK